jgi:hypothetical protein
MASTLPNIPHRVPLVDDAGLLTQAWASFFQFLFQRVGQNNALTNVELATVQTDSVAELTATVAALTTTVATLSASTTSSIDGLNQGRAL